MGKNLNLPAPIPATPMDEPVNLVAIVPEDIYDDISDMNKLDNIYNYCEKKRIDIELLYTTDIENPADFPMFSSYNRERNSYLKAFKEGLCFDKDQYGFSKPAIEKYKEVTKVLE